jgi:cell wall-associated NlpC family hydrolase
VERIEAHRAAILRGLLCLFAVAGIVFPASAAVATPSPSNVENQIDRQWNALEPVIEQYNHVHAQLQQSQAQQKALAAKLGPLELAVNLAMAGVRGLATDAYMQGAPNALDAMIVSGSPTGLTEKLLYVDQLAHHQEQQISGVARLRDQYAADKERLDALTASVAARDAQLAAQKAAIQKKIDALQKLRLQAYGAAGANDGPLRLGPCPVTYTNDKGGRAAQEACSLIGKPYVFGAEGPNAFDCSGLTKTAWASVGVHLEHYTGDQLGEGKPVSRSDLQPGDLVFYYGDYHHVAIYVGGGKVVQAPHSGDHVRMTEMDGTPPSAFRRPG